MSFVKIGAEKATEYEPVNLYFTALTLFQEFDIAIQCSASYSGG
jgi:hypothetical protein